MTTNPRDADEIAVLLHQVEEFHDWLGTNVLFPVVPDTERDVVMLGLGRIKRTLVGALYDLGALDKAKRLPGNVTQLKKR